MQDNSQHLLKDNGDRNKKQEESQTPKKARPPDRHNNCTAPISPYSSGILIVASVTRARHKSITARSCRQAQPPLLREDAPPSPPLKIALLRRRYAALPRRCAGCRPWRSPSQTPGGKQTKKEPKHSFTLRDRARATLFSYMYFRTDPAGLTWHKEDRFWFTPLYSVGALRREGAGWRDERGVAGHTQRTR